MMNFKTLLVLAAMSTVAAAQMINQPTGSLVVNGVDGSSPNLVWMAPPAVMNMKISGNPGMPFILANAPAVSIGESVFSPTIAVDIGPFASIGIVMDGTSSPLVNPFNLFANTGPSGTAEFNFSLPPGTGVGTKMGLQAFVVDFTIPGFLGCTAATELAIGDRFGTVAVSADGPIGSGAGVFESSHGDDLAQVGATLEMQEIGLSHFGEFWPNENPASADRHPGSIRRFVPPTASESRWFGGLQQEPFVRTQFGDIYIVRTPANLEFAFMQVVGTTRTIIPGTSFPSNNGTSAWEKHITIQGGTMAACLDGHGLVNDRVFLIKIDGVPHASTGTLVREITPTASVPSDIRAESFVIASNVLFFAGRVAPSTQIASHLYRCDTAGSVVATSIALPLIQNTPNIAATRVVPEFRLAPDGASFFYKSSNDTDTVGRIHRVSGITTTTQSFTVVSFFSAPQPRILDLGRASDGTNNRFSVNPIINRVAFVAVDPVTGSEELRHGAITGGPTSHITTDLRMDPAIDTILEPHFIDNSLLVFFAGTSETEMDLYVFNISNNTLANLTKTNGVTSATLPLPSTPPAKIDPLGAFAQQGHFYFLRGGFASTGSVTAFPIANMVGVQVATENVYDITGDEFDLTPNPSMTVAAYETELFIDSAQNRVWFTGNAFQAGQRRLYSFPTQTVGPAVQSIPALSAGGTTADLRHLRLAANGDCIATLRNAGNSGSSRVLRAAAGQTPTTLIDEALDFRISTTLEFPSASGATGLWFLGSPTAVNGEFNVGFVDETTGAVRILGGPAQLFGAHFLGATF